MSSVTTHLSLVKYDLADNITPAGYNSNFDTIDSEITFLKNDYITSQGETDEWYWRKWNSGFVELGKVYSHQVTPADFSYLGDQNDYHNGTTVFGRLALPFALTKVYTEQISAANVPFWSNTGYVIEVGKIGGGVSICDGTVSGTWRIVCWNGRPDVSFAVSVSIDIKGRWR